MFSKHDVVEAAPNERGTDLVGANRGNDGEVGKVTWAPCVTASSLGH